MTEMVNQRSLLLHQIRHYLHFQQPQHSHRLHRQSCYLIRMMIGLDFQQIQQTQQIHQTPTDLFHLDWQQ